MTLCKPLPPGSFTRVDSTKPLPTTPTVANVAPSVRLLEKHKMLCKKAFDLMQRKNHDYTSGGGDPFANFRMSAALGIPPEVGICLRIGDKLQRIRTFAEKGELQVKGESVEDSVLDIINYACLIYGLVTEDEDVHAY